MKNYSDEYRDQVLQKLMRPGGPGVREISEETGIHAATLYKWIRDKKSGRMSGKRRSPRNWSLMAKQEALLEASKKSDEELGHWLREKGLHSDHLVQFEKQITAALEIADRPPDRTIEIEMKKLKQNVCFKDKIIAELSALLVLKKKSLKHPDDWTT